MSNKLYALCSSRQHEDYMLPYIFENKEYALQKAATLSTTTNQHIWVEEHMLHERGYIEVTQNSTTRTAIIADSSNTLLN